MWHPSQNAASLCFIGCDSDSDSDREVELTSLCCQQLCAAAVGSTCSAALAASRSCLPGCTPHWITPCCFAPYTHAGRCVGVILQDVVDKAKTCTLIKGDSTLGVFLRTATRTDVTRLAFPSTP